MRRFFYIFLICLSLFGLSCSSNTNSSKSSQSEPAKPVAVVKLDEKHYAIASLTPKTIQAKTFKTNTKKITSPKEGGNYVPTKINHPAPVSAPLPTNQAQTIINTITNTNTPVLLVNLDKKTVTQTNGAVFKPQKEKPANSPSKWLKLTGYYAVLGLGGFIYFYFKRKPKKTTQEKHPSPSK